VLVLKVALQLVIFELLSLLQSGANYFVQGFCTSLATLMLARIHEEDPRTDPNLDRQYIDGLSMHCVGSW